MHIDRIIFLTHPYSYAESLRSAYADKFPRWEDYHVHELKVARRWHETLDTAGERDFVVFHPCYRSDEAKALAQRGESKLGTRFLTLSMRERIYTPEILGAIAGDIEEAFRVRGKYNWYAHDLRVAAVSWAFAQDILSAFKERGISFDPSRTSLLCMGESFEGCANNWTTMLPDYLGIPTRVRMPYELSVPDTHFLLACRHQRRVELAFDTALHLFIEPGGVPLILFVRERVRLADPAYYATVDLDPERIRIRIRDGTLVYSDGRKLSDKIPPSFVRKSAGGKTDLMVASGRWRGGDQPPYAGRESHLFVTADSMDPKTCFSMAENALIQPEK